jgi:hypothetical protein
MKSRKVICPNCKGKGHVMDGAAAMVACLSVVLIPLIFCDSNKNGLTREVCSKCDGEGIIDV